ncbi:uncharacterized protein IL334_001032 [Kwoniella shivajii]|uniref:HAD phosphatase, family IIIA n=1 Tax=Kwoniella shivajii TaxID=564305 RepID=A0ABZ1CQT6_9TREE|nr:hypothetical protein IL334_001032 [Kwoniella shivajii]
MAPVNIPNILIYFSGIIRPKLLRPHLRVPSIANVDFVKLRKEGYNAVVIDKDNCLTLPSKDDIYPPYQTAWNDLLETFNPGKVLIVSNSAGTKKDPGGIAAEAVSLSLVAPVLIHSQAKPGCSSTIISYFQGKLGKPITLRKRIIEESNKVLEEEKSDEQMLWSRWSNEVSGPLLGHYTNNNQQRKGDRVKVNNSSTSTSTSPETTAGQEEQSTNNNDELRLLVIGDRLFTDTLLAHRLSLHLPKPKPTTTSTDLPSVLSIYTTSLPQPKDVRPLRWLEERLSSSKTKGDYTRFILRENEDRDNLSTTTSDVTFTRGQGIIYAWRWFTPSRWKEFDQSLEPLTINPKSWKPLPLLVGSSKSLYWTIIFITRYTINGVKYIVNRIRSMIDKSSQKSGENDEKISSPVPESNDNSQGRKTGNLLKEADNVRREDRFVPQQGIS